MFDYHIHSNWSFDAEDSLEGITEEAAQIGLTEICFTEHIEPGHPYDLKWDGFIDYPAYSREIKRVRGKYPQIEIKTGLELGLAKDYLHQIHQFVAERDIDFIIASQHIVQGFDPYFPEYFKGKPKRESEEVYLQTLLENLRGFTPYSVVGHIGYVCKNSPYHEPLQYDEYADLIDEILKTAINSGHGIEVNTSGYGKYNEPMPTPDIIRRFLALGGEIITIGSDAHLKERVGGNFSDALELLR
ncbi:MAG: histidinol-phosphatase HisJ family protein, partial [Eubacteriales bacterium]